MKKRILRGIINGFTLVMVFVFLISVAAVDSESWIPLATMLFSFAWLYVYALAKGAVYKGGDRE